MKDFIIIITGPTGVGKTAKALALAEQYNAEIINADMGQLYKPLTIGTAKPDWRSFHITHHLFDVIDKPVNYTSIDFRNSVEKLINEIYERGKVPLIVGGSSFYINSLFFPPQGKKSTSKRIYNDSTDQLWLRLKEIDPQRAKEIDCHDRYRIERALDIWFESQVLPSHYKPTFSPLTKKASFIVLTRDKEDLYERINVRVQQMFDEGWIGEVKGLSPEWHAFLLQKKIIGYDDIINFLNGKIVSKDELIALIQQKTRNYAKRQLTFNRMLIKKFEEHCDAVYTKLVNVTDDKQQIGED